MLNCGLKSLFKAFVSKEEAKPLTQFMAESKLSHLEISGNVVVNIFKALIGSLVLLAGIAFFFFKAIRGRRGITELIQRDNLNCEKSQGKPTGTRRGHVIRVGTEAHLDNTVSTDVDIKGLPLRVKLADLDGNLGTVLLRNDRLLLELHHNAAFFILFIDVLSHHLAALCNGLLDVVVILIEVLKDCFELRHEGVSLLIIFHDKIDLVVTLRIELSIRGLESGILCETLGGSETIVVDRHLITSLFVASELAV
nr:MAG TPA: hypothetical protein [Caudoviricetes sp.]